MVPRHAPPSAGHPRLALRAQGGAGVGVGHLARCLALTQAWRDRRGEATLVSHDVPEPWAGWYRDEGVDLVEPGGVVAADVGLVDGYPLELADLGPLGNGPRVRIDDHGLSPREPVDLLLDQTAGADPGLYPHAGRVLVGPRYVLLRRSLVALAQTRASGGPETGRGDPDGPVDLLVVRGGAPTPEVVEFFDAVLSHLDPAGWRVRLLTGGQDPGEAMASADLALSAAGSTSWELSLLGVPAVLVAVAENQEPVGRGVGAAGAARYLGPHHELDPVAVAGALVELAADPASCADLARGGRALVDGQGAARVATRVRSLLVRIRRAQDGDAERIHRWNDDPLVRAASFQPDPIPWGDHTRWFADRLADPATPIYVATDAAGGDLGVVRFDGRGDDTIVSVALAAERRGQGWGGAVIDAGFRAHGGDRPATDEVVAVVRAGNDASRRAFIDADFDLRPDGAPGTLRYARVHGTDRR